MYTRWEPLAGITTGRRTHSLFLGITIFGEIPLPLLIPHQGVVLQEFSVAV